MKQQFLVDKTDTIRLTVYDKNRPQIPTSATITLSKPDGGALQASASATVDATTGEMTYALTATHTDVHDLNYKAVWAYIIDSVTYYQTQLFDVVKSILAIPITDDDLYLELDSLRLEHTQDNGTASSATTSTLVDTAKRKEPDDFWKGGTNEILGGTGAGQKRDITGFTQSTSTIAVSPNWQTTPDSTSTYRIVKSFYAKIEQCFKKIETMLYDKGKRDSLILESSQVEIPLIYLTVHFICLDLSDEIDDKWDRLAKTYWEKFQSAFNNLTLEYDEDESGTIQGDEEQSSTGELRIRRA